MRFVLSHIYINKAKWATNWFITKMATIVARSQTMWRILKPSTTIFTRDMTNGSYSSHSPHYQKVKHMQKFVGILLSNEGSTSEGRLAGAVKWWQASFSIQDAKNQIKVLELMAIMVMNMCKLHPLLSVIITMKRVNNSRVC